MARWRKGDFGRYRFENDHRPSFEFHGRDGDVVLLWHNGESCTRKIPVKTFLRDCVSTWVVSKVGVDKPPWLVVGARLRWGGEAAPPTFLDNPPPDDPDKDLFGLVVRHVHVDFFSGLDAGKLRFFEIAKAERLFVPDVTAWDLLDRSLF